jgi:hypothetical protein
MTVDDVLNYFGSGYAMHKEIGLSPSNIKNWLSYGYIPLQTQFKLQRLTNGGLKVNEKDISDEMQGVKIKLEKGYEFSQAHYNALFEEQNGECDICKQPEKTIDYRSGKKISLAFDHNHSTGKSRGLLCGNCNRMLGFCRDDPTILKNSLIYLEKHNSIKNRMDEKR